MDLSTCRSFYKHILAKAVKHQDMESEDYEFDKNLSYLIGTKVEDMGYTTCTSHLITSSPSIPPPIRNSTSLSLSLY